MFACGFKQISLAQTEANPKETIVNFVFLVQTKLLKEERLFLHAAKSVNHEPHSQPSLKSCYLKKLCHLIIHYLFEDTVLKIYYNIILNIITKIKYKMT